MIDNKVINNLKQHGLYYEKNNIFYATVLPNALDYILLGGTIANITSMTNFVVNGSEKGITIIPCNFLTNEPLYEQAALINKSNIAKIIISKGSVGFLKIEIYNSEKIIVALQVPTNLNENDKSAILETISEYSAEHAEMIKNSKKTPPFSMLLFFIIIIVFAGLGVYSLFEEGNYFLGIIIILAILYYLYLFIKKNLIKK